jgi:transposase
MRPIGTAQELQRLRAVEQGESPDDVARFLGCGRSSVYAWVKLAKQSVSKLAAKPHPGSTSRLDDGQIRELEGLLLQGARAHGWHNDLWSAYRVAEVIRRHFGVSYHTEHVRKVIRRRLNWSSQKPQKKARQRDEGKIAH